MKAREAIWKALLELEPKFAQMEEPDVPGLTDKFLHELRLSGFALVPLAESEKLKGAKGVAVKSRATGELKTTPKAVAKKEKTPKRFRRPVDSEANS
jgi:hypothetical protein